MTLAQEEVAAKVQPGFKISEELYHRIRKAAIDHRVTAGQFVERAMREYLDRPAAEQQPSRKQKG